MQDVGSVRRGEVIKVNPALHTAPESVNFCLITELTENANRGSRVHFFFFFLTQVGPLCTAPGPTKAAFHLCEKTGGPHLLSPILPCLPKFPPCSIPSMCANMEGMGMGNGKEQVAEIPQARKNL